MSATAGETSCKINVLFGPCFTPPGCRGRGEKPLCEPSPTESSRHSVALEEWWFIDFSGCFSSLLFEKILSLTEVRQENHAWSWSGVRGQQAAPGDSGMRNVQPDRSCAGHSPPMASAPSIQWSPFRMSALVSPLLTGAAPVAGWRPEMATKVFPVLFPNVWYKWKRHWAWVASWSDTYPHPRKSDRGWGAEAADVFVGEDTINQLFQPGAIC